MWPFSSGKDKDKEIERLEEKVEKLQEDEDRWRKRFEAEKERRSKLSKEKQEAEERANRLKDKIEGLKSDTEKDDSSESSDSKGRRDLDFEEARRVISKISSVASSEDDLVTVYSEGDRENIDDVRGLKNSISGEQFKSIDESGLYFFDEDEVFDLFLDVRPFFDSKWFSGESFSVGELEDFVGKEKIWVKVSAGNSKVFRESDGELELLEHVKDRVDRQHSSGGFSQSRFERKRDEQIQGHVKNVDIAIPDEGEVFLVGEKDLCRDLPGQYLGGFDPNKSDLEALYGFGVMRNL
ncbi:Vms1/Ankzf1 family peptidyl-tRNA hydrolase [Candidatus Nanohalovita haloferacivicina]|uniref:Vms1/Ankzf1 family peptidyl-tRNA hydrolase n=1 Tax=Candidatus Nanohalovita haloferacivicina TaxID=2978046 RepID=UPI00325FC973|nr:Peptide chain release factor-like protein [Candidatus Nanohalobia archaeon BNXNv]